MATTPSANGRHIELVTIVRKIEGKNLRKPEVVYRFSNGRKFTSTDRTNHGIYSGTGT